MFKLESYIAPFIMGYIDRYVKLRHEDFQISLWGGDAVLTNLDLRLDAIEHAVQLPITLKSGHIHELRIHVPWTNFGSESIVITINTIECVIKLRDSRADERSSGSSPLPGAATPQQRKDVKKQEPDDDLPPGYIQGYINKIVNNVNIKVNNLILKFVDSLTENQREVVRLKFQNGLSYKEIAAVTQLSSSNVGYLIHTAIHRLRQELGVHCV